MRPRPALAARQPRLHQLAAGESLFMLARAGTCLIVQSGGVTLVEAPVWLGERMHQPRAALQPGQSHAISAHGWITLTGGRDGARLCVAQPQAASGWLWLAWCASRVRRGLAALSGVANA